MFSQWIRRLINLSHLAEPPADETTCADERQRYEAKQREIDARLRHLRLRAEIVKRGQPPRVRRWDDDQDRPHQGAR